MKAPELIVRPSTATRELLKNILIMIFVIVKVSYSSVCHFYYNL